MSAKNRKGPIIDPGVCRCCGATKKCRLLNVEYEFAGQKEVYSDMFVDCFGLVLSNLDTEDVDRLICANCVQRLREANSFRHQVLTCEQKLLQTTIQVYSADSENMKTIIEVKQEPDTIDLHHSLDSDWAGSHHSDDISDIKAESELIQENKLPKRELLIRNRIKSKKQNDMLIDMRKMKAKLERMLSRDSQASTDIQPTETQISHIQPTQLQATVDKDYNALQNAITIVQNSYVCPFKTVFSDFYCAYCKEMFTDPDRLREHTMTHDPQSYKDLADRKNHIQIDITRIDCRHCAKTIENVDDFKYHITSAHGHEMYDDVSNEFLKFRLKTGRQTCLECNRSFSFFHALKIHMAEHFGTYICDMCGAHYFDERKLIVHRKTHESETKSFPCADCDKVFKSKSGLLNHISRIHRNEPYYACNRCEEMFDSYGQRYKHKMEVHGEQRSFPCEKCNKVYNKMKTLREHNKKNHLRLLKHECTYCDKKFYLPSALKDHMTSHTGERNFRCEYCGKSYPRKRALRVHLQSHSSEKKYKCNLCTASYTQVNNYKNHMKSKHQMQNGFHENM